MKDEKDLKNCTTNGIPNEELMKTKECIHCISFWECKGKPKKDEPCLHYEENPNNPELKEGE